jgi:hypothetical protein
MKKRDAYIPGLIRFRFEQIMESTAKFPPASAKRKKIKVEERPKPPMNRDVFRIGYES